jgi:hypothetical protein
VLGLYVVPDAVVMADFRKTAFFSGRRPSEYRFARFSLGIQCQVAS